MRNKFDMQLGELNTSLIEMGALIENAIAAASIALTERNVELANKSIELERQIDQKEKEIESLCLKLLLQQQPVARDLSLISAALKMITDMERIGDQAADISELAIFMSRDQSKRGLEHIPQMARATVGMVTDSIDAFVKRDESLARKVCQDDDIVDALFVEVKNDLISMIRENSENAGRALDLLMAAKYFERIGDHAVNVAEWVVFSMHGRHEDDSGVHND